MHFDGIIGGRTSSASGDVDGAQFVAALGDFFAEKADARWLGRQAAIGNYRSVARAAWCSSAAEIRMKSKSVRHSGWRWSIRSQLLVPVLLVVIVAILGASGLSAYLAADWAQRRQEDNLARVVATLIDASFPLNASVLKMMNGLSAADFAVLGPDGTLLEGSRTLSDADQKILAQLPQRQKLPEFSASQTLDLDSGRFLASRLRVRGESTTLVVLYPEERWSLARREVIFPPLVVGGAAVFVVVVVTTFLARRVVRPLEALQRQAAAIEKGVFLPMPLGRGNDEIQDLAHSINHMVTRLASYEADVRRNERLRTLGRLGAGIAHQMRNAATGARLALDLHRQDCPLGETCEALDVASRQLSLIEAHSKRFLVLGRNEATQHEPVDLGQLVDEVLPLVRPVCNHARIDLQFTKPATPVVISGDASALGQLLINLLTNAIEAAAASPMPAANGHIGAVSVSLQQVGVGAIECRVSDSGVGPSEAVKTQLFEPFISDKPDGTGLGLAVARQIARQHDAELSWHRDDRATQFVVSFVSQSQQRREMPCAC